MAVIIIAMFILNYITIENSLKVRAEEDLKNIHQNVYRSTNTLLHTAITNYLRGITEKNIDIIEFYFNKYQSGKMTEKEAKDAIMEKFLLQKVGKTGYLVAIEVINDSIKLDMHPFMRGEDCSENESCQNWAEQKNGYCEYDWKNPNDNSFRKKVAYIKEFKPWNWVVGASSYKDEFIDLVNIEDLKDLIKPIKINKSGYFFVFDENENENKLLIHPELEGKKGNKLITKDGKEIAPLLINDEDGFVTYEWKNPSDGKYKLKYAYVNKLEGYDWYLVASGYVNEIYEPISKFKIISLWITFISAVVLLVFIIFLSRRITAPLKIITDGINKFNRTKEPFEWKEEPVAEIDYLGKNFSSMTADLQKYMNDLHNKIEEVNRSKKEKASFASFLTNIINSMPSVIIGVTKDIDITHWNSKAEKITGNSMSEALGKNLLKEFPLLNDEVDKIKSAIENAEMYTSSITDESDENENLYYDITVYPLSGESKTAAIIRMDDITDKVRLEESLNQSQKMDAIGQLAGGVAHDFNNMLTGILSSVENLEDNISLEQNKKSLEIIKNAALRTRDLTKNLLDFSRQKVRGYHPFSIHEAIENTVHMLKHSIKKNTILKTEFRVKDDYVLGDESKIQNVLLNLGINSDYAMDSGGTLSYKTSLIKDKSDVEMIRIEVSDTGAGIPDDIKGKIFDPFFTTKKQGDGTGLGLASAYATVKQHNGKINVISEINRGTTFTIDLPLTEKIEKVVNEATEEEGDIDGCTVLLVDDEYLIRETASLMIDRLGAKVIEAENGEMAINIYKEQKDSIDIVLLDMRMPVMDGPACFNKLKEINPNVRVIVSSGFSKEGAVEEMEKNGLAGFVNKPYRRDELKKVLFSIFNY